MTGQLVDALTRVVLAPNPSPMTLEGTNTYLLGAPGAGEALVVDPGPALDEHRRAIEATAAAADAAIVGVVLTHHHPDHAEAVGWAASWAVPCWAFSPGLVGGEEVRTLRDGDVLRLAGVALEAVHTPGHCSDHLCLRVAATDVVLTGDHVLGAGTTVVSWPDGDMAAYLDSLRRLGELGATALYPGHGPVRADPAAIVDEYRRHRLDRERQVIAALEAGAETAAQIVARVYADVDTALHAAAARSVRAHLDKLAAEGRIRRARADRDADAGAEERFVVSG